MDEEELRLDIAEAIGKASAAICIQDAVLATLVVKGILSVDDVATIAGLATEGGLKKMEGLSPEALMLGESALKGFAKSWTKHLTKN